jgi:hypothetical protein
MPLYCQECDQRYDGKGFPVSDHGCCQDCGERLVPYLHIARDRYGNAGRLYPELEHRPDPEDDQAEAYGGYPIDRDEP